MSKKTRSIAFILNLAVMLLTTTNLHAQNDGSRGLFGLGKSSADYENSGSRGMLNIQGNTDSGISNQGIGEAPLGSGLLLLSLAGAGYAALRRKRSRKGTALLLACVMLLGFTQCKKELPAPQAESVRITLSVDDGNKDSRVIVNPTGHQDPDFATVTFEEGDVIYVGNNGKYCGFLTYDGTNFTGTINPTSGDNENTDYLHFYFMGNKTPSNIKESGESAAALAPNSTTSFDVNITDQTAKYPVISYAPSTQLFNSNRTTYKARLMNKCAIVKFNISTDNTNGILASQVVSITGMNNIVTVNFATAEPYTFSKYGEGDIKLHAESDQVRWAILLPQAAVSATEASGPGSFTVESFAVPAINANDYKPNGIDVTLHVPTPGTFTINKDGGKVYFAPGNLQYTRENTSAAWSTGSWSFMPNQTDIYPTSNNSTAGIDYVNFTSITHFGWGTSGYHNSGDSHNVYYQPWCTAWDTIDRTYAINAFGYGPSLDQTDKNLTGTSKQYDWGEHNAIYNPVSNTTDPAGTWRTPTSKEMKFILGPNITVAPSYYGSNPNTRRSATVNGVPNARFAKAFLFGTIHGLIIFPDGYVHPDGVAGPDYINVMDNVDAWSSNQYNSTDWNKMQTAGAVFLPGAGCHETTKSGNVSIHSITTSEDKVQCYYWTSTAAGSDGLRAMNVRLSRSDMVTESGAHRARGCSVRLVKDYIASE